MSSILLAENAEWLSLPHSTRTSSCEKEAGLGADGGAGGGGRAGGPAGEGPPAGRALAVLNILLLAILY